MKQAKYILAPTPIYGKENLCIEKWGKVSQQQHKILNIPNLKSDSFSPSNSPSSSIIVAH